MTSFRVRPKFKQLSPVSKEEIIKRLEEKIAACPTCIEGKLMSTHGLLRIKPEDQHFWSPQLAISFESTPEGTVIRGMYGPHPTVWSLFVLGYAILGFSFFFAALVGFARMSLQLSYGILWALPVILILYFFMYLLSQTGQKMGAEQTFLLHHFYEDAIGEKTVIL
jgi:hypothetical protein